ncbi:hypothetical protein OOZ51_10600 [Arthrobacter sp. MI7-26]|uniref:hypothetical protein n=1 Tax=Arthrobacter sp. MI7-26 TaxID=2993653 RepID=UPI00224964C2|nr:hypothetical protein [Arthrobacter sp. MI7-26]MCX2748260.1 hypothetical protein [Arthrobacter sp. MI7-26]
MHTDPRNRRRIATRSAAAAAATLALGVGCLIGSPAEAATTDTLNVDLSQTTGTFRGGASGALYGLSDDGVPT